MTTYYFKHTTIKKDLKPVHNYTVFDKEGKKAKPS